jgi:hypothetical protein
MCSSCWESELNRIVFKYPNFFEINWFLGVHVNNIIIVEYVIDCFIIEVGLILVNLSIVN